MTALYHFTCSHAARRIGRYNCLIVPQVTHPLLGIKVCWFTTEAAPDRDLTGLTMETLNCDRMAFRYVIPDPSGCHPWLGSAEREKTAPPEMVKTLEAYGDPEHWWISSLAVAAVYDHSWNDTPVATGVTP